MIARLGALLVGLSLVLTPVTGLPDLTEPHLLAMPPFPALSGLPDRLNPIQRAAERLPQAWTATDFHAERRLFTGRRPRLPLTLAPLLLPFSSHPSAV